MENVRDQEKLEASLSPAPRTARGARTVQGKMLAVGAAESHTAGAPNQDGGPSFFPKVHDELCPENSNMIGVRDHFRPKKPPSKDTRRRIMIMAEWLKPVRRNGD